VLVLRGSLRGERAPLWMPYRVGWVSEIVGGVVVPLHVKFERVPSACGSSGVRNASALSISR
jgi:hypothetical protein